MANACNEILFTKNFITDFYKVGFFIISYRDKNCPIIF